MSVPLSLSIGKDEIGGPFKGQRKFLGNLQKIIEDVCENLAVLNED
jgi:hypothetical protein